MKFYNLINRINKRQLWATMLLIVAISIGIFSCSEDDNTDTNIDEVEAESGFLYSYRLETPQGRVYYMSANPEIPSEANPSESFELGFNSRIYSYGEHPYTWNGDATTMTKWEVDKSTFEFSTIGIVSFAATGIDGNDVGPPLFVSETQAFFTFLREGVIVEWNPSTMEITETYNVEPNPIASFAAEGTIKEWTKYLHDNKLLMPIRFWDDQCCEHEHEGGAMVAVFDLTTKTLEYIQDDRLLGTEDLFVVDENDNIYVVPNSANGFLEYFNVDAFTIPSPWTVLRFNQNGTFDQDFKLNLEEIIPSKLMQVSFVYDNKLVLTYRDLSYTFPSNFDDRWDIYSAEAFSVSIDLTTKEVQPFASFNSYQWSVFWFKMDDINHFMAEDDSGNQYILRQDSFNDFTEVTRMSGGSFRTIARLW
ncbi:MAG: hypothetical protein AAF620_17145 [Bacteroidota bacterium]